MPYGYGAQLTDDEREDLHRRLRDAELQARRTAIEINNILSDLQHDYYAGRRAREPVTQRWLARFYARVERRATLRWLRGQSKSDLDAIS
jgi:hypothetical protein